MASGTTIASIAGALKRSYELEGENAIPRLTFGDDPVLAMIKKTTDWGGEKTVFPIQWSEHQAISANFTASQTLAGATTSVQQISQWQIDTANNRKIYGTVKINGDAAAALSSGGSGKSYLTRLKAHSDSVIRGIGRRLSLHLWRDGWGAIGRVNNSSFATTGLQLTVPYDARNFEYGMQFLAAADLDTSASRNSGALLTVAAVNLDAALGSAQVTTTQNLSTGIAAIAQNDYLFPYGDHDPGSSPAQRCITGFEKWIPFSASNVGTLFGVSRSAHVQRLGGSRLDASGLTIKEAIEQLLYLVVDRGGDPDMIVLSGDKLTELKKELGSKVEYNEIKAPELEVGFRGIAFMSNKNRVVTVVSSSAIPSNRFAVMQTNTWQLLSMGKTVRFLDEDGLTVSRVSDADEWEMRVGGYMELVCTAPGWNGQGSFDGN